ncbi:MAG: putative RNA methylase [Acidobacteria bacterium OLB17]|nr:MAG: putative RNA methylase [Acidobacteria bacterium OLB17]MCZ2391366.1 50S ribosomal protein L11 methyltransferase [Acidobacteriota bacterium]
MVKKTADTQKPLTKKERDERLAAHLPSVLQYHNTMLTDRVRNKLLKKAIRRALKPGMTFADIGAGTGVWAIFAAKLGASRVVAIEAEESLIPVIARLAEENGVAEKIEIVHGRSIDVHLRGRFDVIASEIFDSNAFGKETIASFVDIRERLLAKDGILIPERVDLMAAPVAHPAVAAAEALDLDIKTSFLRQLKLNYSDSLTFPAASNARFLAPPAELISVDLRTVKTETYTAAGEAVWRLRDVAKADAVATFPRSTFLDDIVMDSRESQSWSAGLYPFEKFEKGPGNLKFTLSQDTNSWSASLPDSPDVAERNYSPVFAFSRLKMAQNTTRYRRFSKRS